MYYRFPLSLRHVEEMLLERGIPVSYETVRRWGKKLGSEYARGLRRKQPSRDDIWYLDEVAIMIAGEKFDQDGYVLDEIVQRRRNAKAARRLLMRLLKKQGIAPKRMITDRLRSYGAAKRQVMPHVEHAIHPSPYISSTHYAATQEMQVMETEPVKAWAVVDDTGKITLTNIHASEIQAAATAKRWGKIYRVIPIVDFR
ncbi:transposase-like protein [Aminobacter sp. BE322]